MLQHVTTSMMILIIQQATTRLYFLYDPAEQYQGFPSQFFVISLQTRNTLKLKSFPEILNSEILEKNSNKKSHLTALCTEFFYYSKFLHTKFSDFGKFTINLSNNFFDWFEALKST